MAKQNKIKSGLQMFEELGFVLYENEKKFSFRKINSCSEFVEINIGKSNGQMLGFVEGKQCEFSPKVLEATFTFIRDMGFII